VGLFSRPLGKPTSAGLEAQIADGYGGFNSYRECHHAGS
jgi:hypothetical protein